MLKRKVYFTALLFIMALPALAQSIDLPETGQTTSFAAGDDGDIQAGVSWPVPRFTNNGDGTLTDNLTGLVWVQDGNSPGPVVCNPGGLKTFAEAQTLVDCVNANSYLGRSNWRLPNVNQLESLINAGEANPASWLNAQGFKNMQPGYYWSSTTHAGDTERAWVVSIGDGGVYSFSKEVQTFKNLNPDPARNDEDLTFLAYFFLIALLKYE